MGEETGSSAVIVGTQTDERLWRQEEVGEEPRPTKRASVGIHTNDSFLRLRDEDGELLPGLPNDITMTQIVPKLPWTAFHVLSSVRRRWLQAIRSHKVNDARVRSHSTEELVVLYCYEVYNFVLYSMTNGYYDLPEIPRLKKGDRIPIPARCVSLNGKIYVLGGEYEYMSGIACSKVYVLDVAGQMEWRKCASMKARRHDFGCGSKDGKIYVFGGKHRDNLVRGCEVYDPEQNSWSQIAPMNNWGYRHEVASLGEELFLYSENVQGRAVLEAYHPIKNEWRRVGECPTGTLLMGLGKLLVRTANTIDVYDHEKNSWSHLHSINFGDFVFYDFCRPYDIVAINDELLVASGDQNNNRYPLFRGKGLGGNDTTNLFWEETSEVYDEPNFPCTIQL